MRDAAIIVLDGGIGSVPGGHQVWAGDFAVFHLAVCRDCGGMVLPFSTRLARNTWAAEHPHEVSKGIEIRNA